MNRNLKIFLAGGPFRHIHGSIVFISVWHQVGLPGGLISGFFGFVMFIILGFLHSRAVEKS
jgi:hypothetical protein